MGWWPTPADPAMPHTRHDDHARHNPVISRRALLRRGSGAALGAGMGAGMGAGLGGLFTPHTAHAAHTPGLHGHRALVCVFLRGGNDSGNTVIPYSGSPNGQDHAHYAKARTHLALPQHQLQRTRITPANTGGRVFALHPALRGVAKRFAAGDVSVVANVGPLMQPTTKAQFQSGRAELPPGIFAHRAQQTSWQVSNGPASSDPAHDHWARRMAQVLQARGVVTHVAAPTHLPPGHPPRASPTLTAQLDTVARAMQQAQPAPHPTRQVFTVVIDGFDHHQGLIADAQGNAHAPGTHGQRLAELNDGLIRFWDQLGALGMRDQVTTFTASDFGRTFKSNGHGSDHGWGGHHFVMGGRQLARGPASPAGTAAQDRGMMFGTFNDLAIDGPDDTGRGRYIPTTSVDEYAHAFASWMGVPAGAMSAVLPNLHRFQNERAPLGMLS